ncbi:MAG: flagellar basal body rod protein FlgB [Legionellales bacterium]
MNQDRTIELVSLALDASLMRQTAIANNIANSNSKGYQTLEVNFEQQLHDIQDPQDLSGIKPFYQLSPEPASMDEQMTLNVQNMTHYRALIKGLNQKLSLMKMALQGNNQ